jgi:cytochrome b561
LGTIYDSVTARLPDQQERMTQLQNSERRYGAVAMALHWLMALLLSALVVLGLYMSRLPDVGFDTRKIRLILYHKQLGIVALTLVALRLLWRLGNVLPRLAETLPDWQKVVARFVHLCFYALMLALPLTGWLMSSATGIPVSALGLFTLPDLVPYDDRLFHALVGVHRYLGYALIACMAAHIGAALRHHFLLRDCTLKKMLPGTDATPAAHRSPAVRTQPTAAASSRWPH